MKKPLAITALVLFAATQLVFAAGPYGNFVTCNGPDCTVCSLIQLANNVIQWLIKISFVLAVGMVIYGGYVIMLTGATSPDAVSRGKKIIFGAVIGVAIILSAWVIVNTVIKEILGVHLSWDWYNIPENCAPMESPQNSTSTGTSNSNGSQTNYSGGGGGGSW